MLIEKILNLKLLKLFIGYSKKVVIPGFDGLPLYKVLLFFFKGLKNGSITTRASSVSFSYFLATFPAIIVFFTLIPYIPIEHFQDNVFLLMKNIIPEKAFSSVEQTLRDIITQPRGGLLSVTFLLAVYFSTNGVNSIIEAFQDTVHDIKRRSFVKQYLVSIALVFILSLVLITGVFLITIGPIVIKLMVSHGLLISSFAVFIIQLVKWIVILGIFFFGYSFLYYLGPVSIRQFRFISAGSSLATVLTILISAIFNYYVNNFSKYNALYGSIGTLILLMVWIYFISITVIIGFELNASINEANKNN